jgi:serine/threonine protein kinase/cytochrome c-type biogenesis protein CcmH/NrfG
MMIGQFVAHYKILEKIGEGGMGIVYKAEDAKLKRTVALKFLPPELTRDLQAKKRFLQEAQAAAALDHPNICAVFEISEAEATMYIVMPYVKGQSLKEKIAAGPLSVEEALDIAGQVGEGLKEAHEKGIIHRDIKPANIMLTEKGQAKIMDFGLAKLAWAADLTKTATTMGTLAYMSPEQARGDAVDHRTDIWSLGVVLYEILAGQLPFIGEEMQGIVYSILNKEPAPLTSIRPDIPRLIVQVVTKALEKDPSRRYQNIQELIQDLKAPAPFIFPKPEKSIIVLPFENMSPDPEQEYFSDGLTEEIITDLSQVHDLLVISRSSAMTFKGTKKTIPEIARAVSVRYVLEGSVRKAGNNLRITAQLIDAINDAHIWAQKFSGTLDDVFDIQEKVSRSIVDVLKIKLSSGENIKISERPIDNIQAYECYLRAKREMFAGTADGLKRALRDFEAALDILGRNVLLYQGMAEAYLQHYEYGIKADEETLQSAEDFTKKVMSLKPNSAEGYYLLGRIERFRGTVIKGIKHFERALAIDPNHSSALLFLAAAYGIQAGKGSLAEPLLRRLQEIDPLTPLSLFTSGYIQWLEGKLDHALLTFQNLIRMEPESVMIKFFMAYLLAWQKNYDQVFSLVDQMVRQGPHESPTLWSLSLKYALQGEKKKALDVLSEEAKKYVWNDPESPWLGASIYALLDEKEEAFLWLEHAIDRGWINYPLFAERNPFFANLRGEERFKKLMERVKYEWEHFEV